MEIINLVPSSKLRSNFKKNGSVEWELEKFMINKLNLNNCTYLVYI